MTHAPESVLGQLPVMDERIRLRREMARGGMGVVYEGRHAFLERPIAVKLARDGLTRAQLETAKARLAREGRLLARLDHPNIVRVLDAGVLADEGPYVVLEKLEGRTLDGLIAVRGSLGLDTTLSFAPELAFALDYVHRRGIVHRDVKPENVFVVGGKLEDGAVKLIDFGIAAAIDEAATGEQPITLHGELLGTLDYVAPEQLRHVAAPTPRSDQYSFAALVYECLTGAPPSWHDRVGAHPEVLGPRIPESIRGPLLRALQPKPEDRYPQMSDFATELASLREESKAASMEIVEQPAPTRRKHVRAPYITPLRILRTNGTNVDGRSQDISEGGLLAIIPAQLDSQERVEVRFALPTSGRMVRIPAVVRWSKSSHDRCAIGLGFDIEARDAAADVSRYVDLMGSEIAAE
jgi:serine/threonine protein kinase